MVVTIAAGNANADDEIFRIIELAHAGRVITADLADLDGDGRKDLMLVTFDGLPPNQFRTIHVHRQLQAGGFATTPAVSVPLPASSAVYDFADVLASPGQELLLLRPDSITVLSLAAADGERREWPLDGPTTLGVADDERGFERFPLVYAEFGEDPWILAPQFGAISALSTHGKLKIRLNVGGRANYYVSSGSDDISADSDFQVYYDAPKVSVGDINGDGHAHVLSATRHELRVFLRDPDGTFASNPSYSVPLGLIGDADYKRGTGSVVTSARDIDADGRLDRMI